MEDTRKELSKTEWSLMKICWSLGSAYARDIHEESLKDKSRGYQTVKTMLDRIAEKGYLRREADGARWRYIPTVSQTALVNRAIESFLSDVLDNRVAPLFAHLVDRDRLSDDEIVRLKRLIEEQESTS